MNPRLAAAARSRNQSNHQAHVAPGASSGRFCNVGSGGDREAGVTRFAKIVSLQMSAAAEIRPFLSEATNLQEEHIFPDNPEFDLLVACCAGLSSHDSSDDISSHERHAHRIRRILSRSLDWDRFLNLVDHHRVVPQVYGQLSVPAHLVPGRQVDSLRLLYQDNARKALWVTGELIRLLRPFESLGINAL